MAQVTHALLVLVMMWVHHSVVRGLCHAASAVAHENPTTQQAAGSPDLRAFSPGKCGYIILACCKLPVPVHHLQTRAVPLQQCAETECTPGHAHAAVCMWCGAMPCMHALPGKLQPGRSCAVPCAGCRPPCALLRLRHWTEMTDDLSTVAMVIVCWNGGTYTTPSPCLPPVHERRHHRAR
jgi:hypothetical protein